MNKTFKISLLTALISTSVAAETFEKTWEAGVFGEYIKSSTSKDHSTDWHHIEAGRGIGIDLKKIIDEQWSARLELAKTRYDINQSKDSDYGTRFGLDAIYNVEDSGLYLFSGIKRFNNVKNYYAVNVGAGYSIDVNDRLSAYTEAVVYRDVNYGYTDQGFKFGLKYAFGDVKKTPIVNTAPKPELKKSTAIIDTDNDGIIDSQDSCNNTAENIKVDARGCALFEEREVVVNLNVSFENNSSQISRGMKEDIQRLANFMKEHDNTSVVIEGHSSAVGSAKYNLTLSQKRADAIKASLINEFDINANRLSAKGFGETQLVSKGNNQADHNKNRRVVAKIKTTVKTVIKRN